MNRLLLLLAVLCTALASASIADARPVGNRATLLVQAHDRDALAWKAAVNTAGAAVTDGQLRRIDRLNRALKASTVWHSLDRLWLFAAENSTQARRDLITRSVANPTNGPTFTANRGYAGDGLTSYVDTGYRPSTDAVRYAQNSASMFTYTNTNRAAGNIVVAGANGTGGVEVAMQLRDTGNVPTANINNTFASGHVSGSAADTLGLQTVSRTASNLTTLYRRATSLGTTATASASLPDRSVWACGLNFGGSLSAPETARIAAIGLGAGLTAALNAALNAALEVYFSAIGANA